MIIHIYITQYISKSVNVSVTTVHIGGTVWCIDLCENSKLFSVISVDLKVPVRGAVY